MRTSVRENRYTREALAAVGVTEPSVTALLGETHHGFVCEVDGQIVGFSMVNRATAEFWMVAVLPEFEGRGIGKRLTQLTQDWLRANGCEEIWLWTSPDTSTRAYHLYAKLGWKDCGVQNEQRIMKLHYQNES